MDTDAKERGCVRSTSRSSFAGRSRGKSPWDLAHFQPLRLVRWTQPRAGAGLETGAPSRVHLHLFNSMRRAVSSGVCLVKRS